MFDIKENLKKLPDSPGVYLHKDKMNNIIYVGKAVSLKKRVSQYFQNSRSKDSKVRAMVEHIDEFEYIKCGSEMEALILENNLIKKYKPKYNILLRDDKTYPYIKITSEKWPRIEKTRRVVKDGSSYFGPYTDVGAVNSIVDLISKVYKLKKCTTRNFPPGFRPCLNYHINQCNGMCVNRENKADYMKRIEQTKTFLKGNSMDLVGFLREEMNRASCEMQYEKAAIYRDYIISAKALMEKQRVVLSQDKDLDVILANGKGEVVVFTVIDGKLSGREIFEIRDRDEDEQNVISAFIKQHYGEKSKGPGEILVKNRIAEQNLIEEFLSQIWAGKVKITVPARGEKKALMEMVKNDMLEMVKTRQARDENRDNRRSNIRKQLSDLIEKSKIDNNRQGYDIDYVQDIVDEETGEIVELFKGEDDAFRVECYDISNTNGVDNVGAMVVFDELAKNRKAYRKFKIKSITGADDYGSIAEVLKRRMERGLSGDVGFLPLPNLILIDGGKGHVEVAAKVVGAYDLNISIVGLAKDDSHRTQRLVYKDRTGEFVEEPLKDRTLLFSYMGNIQEEVHRFAIEFHRSLRDKKVVKSQLDEIPGIGEKKRNNLLMFFGNMDEIKDASIDRLQGVRGISKRDAQNIRDYFDKR